MEITATKATVQKYPAYKASGVEWLGKIPENWDLHANKFVFKLKKNLVGKKSSDYTLLSLTLKGIIQRDLDNGGKFPAEFDTYQEVKKGDFIFCLFDVEETPRCVGLSDFEGMITGAYTVMEVNQSFDKAFLYYFYLNLDADKRMRPLYTGLRNTISKDNFFAFKTFVPSKEEQTAIANFLDDKTSKIDRAIAQKEQLIALLKERKQIIIQNAVTKGLDPNVKMKDSGVEWIGEIPEHWEVEKLFGVCRFIRGNSAFSKDELLENGEYVALQYGKTYKVNEVDEKYEFYVNNEFYKDSQVVNYGDTIFISTSETIEDLGHTAFYNRHDLGLLGGEQMLLKPKIETVNSKYLHFSSKVFSKELRKYATGIKVFRFNINDLKTIYITIPPMDEQSEIVQHVELQLYKIEQAIILQQKQIKKLKEYKSTLIDSAVTGKIKVC